MNAQAQEVAEAVAAAVVDALEKRSALDTRHAAHHAFIERLLRREEERAEMYSELRRHLAKWGAVGVLTFIGVAVWYWLRNHLGGG